MSRKRWEEPGTGDVSFALIETWELRREMRGRRGGVWGAQELTIEEGASKGVAGSHCELDRDSDLLWDWNN